jgi:hypothetical protein
VTQASHERHNVTRPWNCVFAPPQPGKAARATSPTLVAMARSIEFDAERLIGQLNVLQKVQLPYAGNQALKELGFKMRGELAQYMADVFDNPVPFTLRSPRYAVDGLTLTVRISTDGAKGQDPARYLYPVSTEDGRGGKPAYITRFTKAVRGMGVVDSSYYAIPYLQGRGVRKNAYGNMTPGQYQQVLAGLKAENGRTGGKRGSSWRYFSVPDQRGSGRGRGGNLKPGIYRAKSNDLQMLFGYARKHPTVPAVFDFAGTVERKSQELLPSLLSKALARALG